MNPLPRNHDLQRIRLIVAGLAAAGTLTLLAGCQGTSETATAAPPDPDPAGEAIAVSHILVAFDGVRDGPSGLVRSRDEAWQRARRIAVLLRTGRGDLPDMARRYSDDPTAQQNAGYLGVFHAGDMEREFEDAVTTLTEGEIGGPVETPHGFHIVRREPVRRVNIHHILVAYRDAVLAGHDIRRDRTEAAQVANALHRKITAGETDLCALAAQFSDDPENQRTCGDLGWVEPGVLEPDVEQAVVGLEAGEVSPVVESAYGFHIFWRK